MQEEQTNETQPAVAMSNKSKTLFIAGAAVLIALGGGYYYYSQGYESTDNAFLEGHVVQISPREPGQVLRVLVEDNQHVNKGDLIAEIDPADYDTRLADAQARLSEAEARAQGAQVSVGLTSTVAGAVLTQAAAGLAGARDQVEVLKGQLAQQQAAVKAAAAQSEQAQARESAAAAEAERAAADAKRYRALYEKDEVSRQLLDRSETDARAAAANHTAASQAVQGARAQLTEAVARQESTVASLRQVEKMVRQAEGREREAQTAPQQVRLRQIDVATQKAQLESARATFEQAKLNRSYTQVFAPEAGYITRKSVEPGNYVGPGQALMALVADRLWVVANFKETQITRMRPGQRVTVKVDAYPQLKLQGHVDSIQSGTGARFSLIPPENATGNYVKVVQRIPVKIVLDDAPPAGYRLGPGMSVEPEVSVR